MTSLLAPGRQWKRVKDPNLSRQSFEEKDLIEKKDFFLHRHTNLFEKKVP